MVDYTSYGWCSFRPKWLKPVNKTWCLLIVLCIGGFFQGSIVSGFANVALTSIETRFGITAAALSFIPSSYDVAGLICIIPVSYVGGRASQSRILGLGMFIMGIGSFIMFLPHLFTINEASPMDTLKSQGVDAVGFCNSPNDAKQSNLKGWVGMFYLGMMTLGVGATPLWANAFDYLDKNLPHDSFALYSGIFTMAGVVGPGVGYVIGGWFLTYPFDDVLRQDSFYDNLTDKQYDELQENTNFIGAYWLGFLLSSCGLLAVALPLGGFPYEFPESEKLREEKVNEAYGVEGSQERSKLATDMSFADFKKGMKYLFSNPVFICIALAGSMETFFLAVIASFGPKYLETVFNQSSSQASLTTGLILIPTATIALIGGGILVKVLKLTVRKMLIFCFICSTITFLSTFGMFMPCDEANFIKPADQWELPGGSGQVCDVTSCDCSRQTYKPYCLDSTNVLFSPCYFGCDSENIRNCSCYDSNIHNTLEEGNCDISEFCSTGNRNWVYFFLIVTCLSVFVNVPAAEAALDRSVHQDFRSLAFGLDVFAMRILGSIPGPLIAGAIFDSNCRIWQKTSGGERGSCINYNSNFKVGFNLLLIFSTFLMLLCFGLACYFTSKKPKTVEINPSNIAHSPKESAANGSGSRAPSYDATYENPTYSPEEKPQPIQMRITSI